MAAEEAPRRAGRGQEFAARVRGRHLPLRPGVPPRRPADGGGRGGRGGEAAAEPGVRTRRAPSGDGHADAVRAGCRRTMVRAPGRRGRRCSARRRGCSTTRSTSSTPGSPFRLAGRYQLADLPRVPGAGRRPARPAKGGGEVRRGRELGARRRPGGAPRPASALALALACLDEGDPRAARDQLRVADAALRAHPHRLLSAIRGLVAARGRLAEGHACEALEIIERARHGWSTPSWARPPAGRGRGAGPGRLRRRHGGRRRARSPSCCAGPRARAAGIAGMTAGSPGYRRPAEQPRAGRAASRQRDARYGGHRGGNAYPPSRRSKRTSRAAPVRSGAHRTAARRSAAPGSSTCCDGDLNHPLGRSPLRAMTTPSTPELVGSHEGRGEAGADAIADTRDHFRGPGGVWCSAPYRWTVKSASARIRLPWRPRYRIRRRSAGSSSGWRTTSSRSQRAPVPRPTAVTGEVAGAGAGIGDVGVGG